MEMMKPNWYSTASESEQETFREWIRSHLALGEVKVLFEKKDGSEREMLCSTNPNMVVEYVKKTQLVKPISKVTCSAFDIEKQEWRSFRFDSVRQVSFTI